MHNEKKWVNLEECAVRRYILFVSKCNKNWKLFGENGRWCPEGEKLTAVLLTVAL